MATEHGTLVDLRPDIDTSVFRALLLLLVGWRKEHDRDLQRLDDVIRHYHSHPELAVLGFKRAGEPIAIIAIDTVALDTVALDVARPRGVIRHGVIRHIVVHPELRQHGVGRELLQAACAHLGLSTVHAETDRNAVGFYARSGFRTSNLGEKYPGVERFSCTWTSPVQGDAEGP